MIEMFVVDFVRVIINQQHVSNHLFVQCLCVWMMDGIKFNLIYLILHDVLTVQIISKHWEFKYVRNHSLWYIYFFSSFLLYFKIHANCRIRRVYFSDRLYSEDELPPEFKLYLPVKNLLILNLLKFQLFYFRFKRNNRFYIIYFSSSFFFQNNNNK